LAAVGAPVAGPAREAVQVRLQRLAVLAGPEQAARQAADPALVCEAKLARFVALLELGDPSVHVVLAELGAGGGSRPAAALRLAGADPAYHPADADRPARGGCGAKGLRDIARPLAAPGTEVAAADLLGQEAAAETAFGADALLDARARQEYHSRPAAGGCSSTGCEPRDGAACCATSSAVPNGPIRHARPGPSATGWTTSMVSPPELRGTNLSGRAFAGDCGEGSRGFRAVFRPA
jgi:hypothetical protein